MIYFESLITNARIGSSYSNALTWPRWKVDALLITPMDRFTKNWLCCLLRSQLKSDSRNLICFLIKINEMFDS